MKTLCLPPFLFALEPFIHIVAPAEKWKDPEILFSRCEIEEFAGLSGRADFLLVLLTATTSARTAIEMHEAIHEVMRMSLIRHAPLEQVFQGAVELFD